MKIFKYIIIAFASMIALASCEKHDLGYDCEQVDASENAFVYFYRMIPEAASTATRVYRVEIDGQPMWQGTSAYLSQFDYIPAQGRHYVMKPGTHTLKLFLSHEDTEPYYNQEFTVKAGMQDVVITNLNAAPLVLDNNAEYPHDVTAHTAESFYLRFVNIMYEDENFTIPDYKLQYYYQDPTDLEWYPASDPVGFGEVSSWTRIHIDQFAEQRSGQSGSGSSREWADNRVGHSVTSGSCTIYYKMKRIEADGTESWMTYNRKGGAEGSDVEYKDYWTAYVGRHQTHFMRGMRVSPSGSGTGNTAAWISQMGKY